MPAFAGLVFALTFGLLLDLPLSVAADRLGRARAVVLTA